MTQGCISKSGFSHEVYSGCLVGLHPYAIFSFLIIKPVYSTEEQYGNRNKAGPSPKEWAQQWHCQHFWLGEQEALQLCHSSVRPNSLFPSGCAFQTSVVFDLPIICRLNSKQLKCLHVQAAASFGSAVHYKREYFLQYTGWGTGCHNSITFGFLKYSNQSILNSSLQLLNTFLSQNRHKSPPTFCHELFGHSEVLVVQSSCLCRIQWAQPSWLLVLWSKCYQVILWNRVKRTQNVRREGLKKERLSMFACTFLI